MKKDFSRRPLAVFFSYFRPHGGMFAIDMLCALLVSAVDLAFPLVSRWCMMAYLPNRMFAAFFITMGGLVGAYVLKGVLTYVITVVGHQMGVLIEADMRKDVFSHMQELSFHFYDQNRTGALMSRITNDLFDITELAHHGPENVLICTLTIFGALIVMATIQWKLALLIFILLPLLLLITLLQRKRMRKANLDVKKKTAEINAAIESGISGIRTAKAFANESAEGKKFENSNKLFKSAKVGFYRAMGLFQSSMEFTMGVLQVIVIAMGGLLMMQGEMNLVDLLAFSLYVATFLSPIRKLAQFMEIYMQGSAGFARFLEMMRAKPDISDAPHAKELPPAKGEIRYEDVSFSYGEGNVLSHVSLAIHSGECFAVVGPSGGGKTTLCQLLPRFYDVSSGKITIDGFDIRQVTQKSLRRQIGIIQQDVFLFAGSIRENIRYGRPDATDEEVVAAAVQAEMHREILAFPDGYETFVGERGAMLSGGQRQRIAIARVFLKNPPILIFDEATSALDSITEERIQKSLDALSHGRTTIVIAHRLSTIRRADRIAVIGEGGILEMGTRQELLQKNGAFAAMAKAQNLAN